MNAILRNPFGFALGIIAMFLMGMIGSVALHDAKRKIDSLLEERRPVTDWMIVHDLHVSDFRVGENPNVVFHRVVSRSLFGGWGVEVHDEEGRQYCSQTSGKGGGAIYAPSERSRVLIDFQRYTGGCVLPAGKFRITVTIRLSADTPGVVKTISFQSNWFAVSPTEEKPR